MEENFPYIVLAPQCPLHADWKANRIRIINTLRAVLQKYHVDQRRVYLTGFSMGANGVWELTAHNSETFAASVPISGWYDKQTAQKLFSTPLWVFHGEKDDVVSISGSETMVIAIEELGGSPRFTRYPELGHEHEIMYKTYSNPELYTWLEENRKTV